MLRIRVAIFLVTVLVFARLMPAGFTYWDDHETIFQNPRLNPPTRSTLVYYWTTAGEHETMGLYIPVTYTLWSGLAKLARRSEPDADGATLNSAVFHTANVLLHGITAVVVFQLLFRLFASRFAATIGSLLFALHPVQVESVGWVSGTKDILCGLFVVSALLMYLRSVQVRDADRDSQTRDGGRWRYALATLLFVLGMLSKPTAVVTPLLAVVISLFFLNRSLRTTIFSLLPWFVLMIPCLIWTRNVQPPSWVSPLPQWDKPAVAIDAIAFYLVKLVWPAHLGIDYSRNPAAIAASGAIYYTWLLPTALGVWLWCERKTYPRLVAAGLLFLIPLLPLLGFLPFEFQCLSTTADHYLYLPMLGVAVAVAWFVLKYPGRWTTGISLLILVTLAVRSFFQESSWKDARSLLDHALTVNPHSVIAFDGLGFLTSRDAHRLGAAGQLDAARNLFDESIRLYKTSLEYDPMSVPSRINLALDYQQIDRLDLARQQIYAVIALQPKLQPGMRADPISIARFLIDFRDIPGAVDWLETVLRGDPGNRAAFMLYREAVRHLPGPTTIHSSERDPMPDMKNRSVLAGDAVDVSYNH